MSKYKTVWAPIEFEGEQHSSLVFKNNPGPDWTEYNNCVEVIERRALDEAVRLFKEMRKFGEHYGTLSLDLSREIDTFLSQIKDEGENES